jgi:hypothetical protein
MQICINGSGFKLETVCTVPCYTRYISAIQETELCKLEENEGKYENS